MLRGVDAAIDYPGRPGIYGMTQAQGLEPPGPATAGVSEDVHDASDHKPIWVLLALN